MSNQTFPQAVEYADFILQVGLNLQAGQRVLVINSLPFVANVPTEEVATLPHRDRVEGVVAATRPVHYGGQTIDGLKLEFADGRVVAFSAQTGQVALEQILHTDAGSTRLGEVEFADQGGNSIRVHVDFVVGSQALDIDGITPDGEVKAVLRGGEWAFTVGKSSTQLL